MVSWQAQRLAATRPTRLMKLFLIWLPARRSLGRRDTAIVSIFLGSRLQRQHAASNRHPAPARRTRARGGRRAWLYVTLPRSKVLRVHSRAANDHVWISVFVNSGLRLLDRRRRRRHTTRADKDVVVSVATAADSWCGLVAVHQQFVYLMLRLYCVSNDIITYCHTLPLLTLHQIRSKSDPETLKFQYMYM